MKCSRCGGSSLEVDLFAYPSGKYIKSTWKCISCGHLEEEREAVKEKSAGGENTRICAECGQEPTMRPWMSLGGNCMRKRALASRKKKAAEKAEGKAGANPEEKNPSMPPQKPINRKEEAPAPKPPGEMKPPGKDGMAAISIDFQGYPEILEKVKKLAEEEIRPVEFQIVFILKTHLEAHKAA